MDLDHDGDLDVFRTSNFDLPTVGVPGYVGYNVVFEHVTVDGVRKLRDISADLAAIFSRTIDGRGLAFGDIDRDGDMDILIGVAGTSSRLEEDTIATSLLLVNDGTEAARHAWVQLRVSQPGRRNRFAVGAIIDARGGGIRSSRVIQSGQSYASQHDTIFHIGLGQHLALPSAAVTWPDGHVTVWLALSPGEHTLARPADDEHNCCNADGCTHADSPDQCFIAAASILGRDDACESACVGWSACCPGLDLDRCRFACAWSLPTEAVLTCLAGSTCDGLLACTDNGRLLPGGAAHPLGELCFEGF